MKSVFMVVVSQARHEDTAELTDAATCDVVPISSIWDSVQHMITEKKGRQ